MCRNNYVWHEDIIWNAENKFEQRIQKACRGSRTAVLLFFYFHLAG